jgi:hypothetical protein
VRADTAKQETDYALIAQWSYLSLKRPRQIVISRRSESVDFSSSTVAHPPEFLIMDALATVVSIALWQADVLSANMEYSVRCALHKLSIKN